MYTYMFSHTSFYASISAGVVILSICMMAVFPQSVVSTKNKAHLKFLINKGNSTLAPHQ